MTSTQNLWHGCFFEIPLIAILRGIRPDQELDVGEALLESGIRILEVPLNSPSPLKSITQLAKFFGDTMIVGAGTVLTDTQANECVNAGGRLIVAPNVDEGVAKIARHSESVYCPGIATPTEAFRALSLGATALKLFPGEMITRSVVKAMRAVLPDTCQLIPVGGVNRENLLEYYNAGANGFGIGSALYSPGKSARHVAKDASKFVTVMKSLSFP